MNENNKQQTGFNVGEMREIARSITSEPIQGASQRIDVKGNLIQESTMTPEEKAAHLNVTPTVLSVLDDVDSEPAAVGSSFLDAMASQAEVQEEVAPVVNDYDGMGIVLKNEELVEPEHVPTKFTGMDADTRDAIGSYLASMEEETKELEEKIVNNGFDIEAIKAGTVEPTPFGDQDSNDLTEYEFNKKYDEAVVVIDKTGFGRVIDFTGEEHDKMRASKTIKLEEVRTVELKALRTKKIKKGAGALDRVIKKIASANTCDVVLPVSGYTVTLRGLSTYEIISLGTNSGINETLDLQNIWSVIYDKIENTSLGPLTFEQFLLNTAVNDYQVLMYGLLCATYPDADSFNHKCTNPTCKKTFQHGYTTQSLVRAEKMTDRMREAFMDIVDASFNIETATAYHEKAPIASHALIQLPTSGVIAEIQVSSAHAFINKTIKTLSSAMSKEDRAKYADAAAISSFVTTLYIPDDESADMNDPDYFELTETEDIIHAIYKLPNTDIIIIQEQDEVHKGGLVMEYGFMNVECPACHTRINTIPIDDIKDLLFYRFRQEVRD